MEKKFGSQNGKGIGWGGRPKTDRDGGTRQRVVKTGLKAKGQPFRVPRAKDLKGYIPKREAKRMTGGKGAFRRCERTPTRCLGFSIGSKGFHKKTLKTLTEKKHNVKDWQTTGGKENMVPFLKGNRGRPGNENFREKARVAE